MAFELSKVVPWGRTLEEYKTMFNLNNEDLKKSIASFGDGPASFNAEMTNLKNNVTSFDPIYQFTKEQLANRIAETKDIVMKQTKENKDNFIWTTIKDLDELERSILVYMGSNSKVTRLELEKYTNKSSPTVRKRLNHLLKLNLINRNETKYDPKQTYSIVD